MSSHVKSAEGDWICSDLRCGNLNFARRTSCNRCGKQLITDWYKSVYDFKRREKDYQKKFEMGRIESSKHFSK
ncbi:Zinc finger Ran-binding domain-containing protein 2 [Armadillidium vulgare]|nr:Zinc finger Ran-binding domain-containing protein 2 [Armadillidium vulgare]